MRKKRRTGRKSRQRSMARAGKEEGEDAAEAVKNERGVSDFSFVVCVCAGKNLWQNS